MSKEDKTQKELALALLVTLVAVPLSFGANAWYDVIDIHLHRFCSSEQCIIDSKSLLGTVMFITFLYFAIKLFENKRIGLIFMKKDTHNYEHIKSILKEHEVFFVNQNNFDFNDSGIKRKKFNAQRNELLKQLIKERGSECQLKLSDVCEGKRVLDHLIPLSSNEVNKHIRGIKAEKGKKVPSESLGSNHTDNLLIACGKCNNFKKHRFVKKNKQGGFEIVNLVKIS